MRRVSIGMTTGVELWYNEKDDYLNQTGGVTGHYTSMISPSNRYVGMGAFGTSTAQYYSTSYGVLADASAIYPSRYYRGRDECHGASSHPSWGSA